MLRPDRTTSFFVVRTQPAPSNQLPVGDNRLSIGMPTYGNLPQLFRPADDICAAPRMVLSDWLTAHEFFLFPLLNAFKLARRARMSIDVALNETDEIGRRLSGGAA